MRWVKKGREGSGFDGTGGGERREMAIIKRVQVLSEKWDFFNGENLSNDGVAVDGWREVRRHRRRVSVGSE